MVKMKYSKSCNIYIYIYICNRTPPPPHTHTANAFYVILTLNDMLTFAQLCRCYPCPASIAMTAFLSLGLPRCLFPPIPPSSLLLALQHSCLLITWPYHERRFWVTCSDWLDHCIAPELFISDSVFSCFP